MRVFRQFSASWIASALAALLSACGGGSAAPAASVSGTAATGAAIASGSVTLKCVSGTSTAATTGTDGGFSIDVSGVTLPCVGRVDYKDASGAAQKLHTFISAAGTANITPITELLVANLTAGTAADAFDKFDATKSKTVTAAQIKTAADAVKTYLKNTLGVDVTNLPDDPIGTKFVATVGSTAGDKADKVLDDLAAKLKTASKKLADAVGDLGKATGSSSSGGTTAPSSGGLSNCPRPASVAALTFSCGGATAPTGGVPATQADIDMVVGDYTLGSSDLLIGYDARAFASATTSSQASTSAACKLTDGTVYLAYGTGSRLVFTPTATGWSVGGSLPGGASFSNRAKVSCSF